MAKIRTPYPEFCKGDRDLKLPEGYKSRGTPAKDVLVGKGMDVKKVQKYDY
jgi:hypothetical protein